MKCNNFLLIPFQCFITLIQSSLTTITICQIHIPEICRFFRTLSPAAHGSPLHCRARSLVSYLEQGQAVHRQRTDRQTGKQT